jgi:hypothetical protein
VPHRCRRWGGRGHTRTQEAHLDNARRRLGLSGHAEGNQLGVVALVLAVEVTTAASRWPSSAPSPCRRPGCVRRPAAQRVAELAGRRVRRAPGDRLGDDGEPRDLRVGGVGLPGEHPGELLPPSIPLVDCAEDGEPRTVLRGVRRPLTRSDTRRTAYRASCSGVAPATASQEIAPGAINFWIRGGRPRDLSSVR